MPAAGTIPRLRLVLVAMPLANAIMRRVFLVGAAGFATASAIGGLAPEFEVLLAAGVVQGVCGALMLPATVAIISRSFPPEQRGRALGTMGGAAAVFAALGPTIGGVLTSVLSWRAVLLVNVPLAVFTIVLARRHVPADPVLEAAPAPSCIASTCLEPSCCRSRSSASCSG